MRPSFEIIPPLKGMSRDELLESVKPLVELDPSCINVTRHREEYEFIPSGDGSFKRVPVRPRMSQEEVCRAISEEFKVEVVPHLICAGSSREEVRRELESYLGMGVRGILALRGDCLLGEKRFTPAPDGFSYASEMVAAIRSLPDSKGLGIAVGGYPEKHFEAPNLETDILNLKRKVDAGADCVITQMFFDNAVFYDFVGRCREAGINVPIVPGLKPLSSLKQISMLPESFSIDIPEELCSRVRAAGDSAEEVYRIGTQWTISQCRDLIAHGFGRIHFYTMGRTRNITEIVRECF